MRLRAEHDGADAIGADEVRVGVDVERVDDSASEFLVARPGRRRGSRGSAEQESHVHEGVVPCGRKNWIKTQSMQYLSD